MRNFGIIGAAGYIAPRHLRAIKDTGNNLSVAYDPCDSVGILDSYFPQCSFFTQYELFDCHLSQLQRTENRTDIITVCTPNYLHDAHTRYGLRLGCDVICEKPVVLDPRTMDSMEKAMEETGKTCYTILQLRLHDAIRDLKTRIESAPKDKIFDIDLTYITSRGLWYYASWKGDLHKSGGIATNIGVHFYDMLLWIFGPVEKSVVHVSSHDRVAGFLQLKRARVRYFLSINADHLPPNAVEGEKRTFRTLTIDGEEFEFSKGFTELHTQSYKEILAGRGFKATEARQAVELVYNIRKTSPVGLTGDYHPLAAIPLCPHPFGW